MRRAHHLLKDDRHLLFFQAVGRGAHIGLRMLAEGGSVHPLDRLHQLLQAHVNVGVLVGQHERLVDAGERLILRILQQARRTHRQGIAHLAARNASRSSLQRAGKRRCQEAPQRFRLRRCMRIAKSSRSFSPTKRSNQSVASTTLAAPRSARPGNAARTFVACAAGGG